MRRAPHSTTTASPIAPRSNTTANPTAPHSKPTAAPRATAAKSRGGAVSAAPGRPPAPHPAPPSPYATRADVRAFVDDLVAREHFDRDALMRLLGDARYSETAARLLAPSATSGVRRDWNAYRARFVEPVRLAAGYRFWDDNADTLARAEREFGVPAEIIVGIVGVETVYGRNTGSFRVLDVLCTLAFDFPASGGRDRSAFFREQLADALAMDRDGSPTWRRCAARTPVRSACRSSCRAASARSRSTTTATVASTSAAARPT